MAAASWATCWDVPMSSKPYRGLGLHREAMASVCVGVGGKVGGGERGVEMKAWRIWGAVRVGDQWEGLRQLDRQAGR